MAILSIDSVTIEGKSSAFGGYIYSVGYNIGVNQQSSTVSIRFINETKNYLRPVGPSQPYKIQIGNIINSNFYVKKWNTEDSSQGKS